MTKAKIIAAVDERISQLLQARRLLMGHETGNGRTASSFGGGSTIKPRTHGASTRAKIAAAQKKRWARARLKMK